LPRAHGRDLEADCPCYCGQKNEPRCGIDTRARGAGHGYYLLLRKVLFEENRKIPGRTADLTAVRRWSMITGLLVPAAFGADLRAGTATLGVFVWLQITHINLWFVFLFFAHITFLSLLVVSLVLGCASRAEIPAAANDLFVWDQVIQTDQLIFRTLLPLSSTLPRICVLFFLRRTHIRPITTICAMTFLAPVSSAIRRF
jgi:hypothetical protein